MRDHFGRLARQELGDPGDPVANEVLQQFPRQPANPMVFVSEKRSRISRSSELVAVRAFHVHRPAAQETTPDKSSHAPSEGAELVVMPRGDLETSCVRECDEPLRLFLKKRERLLQIDVAAGLQTKLRKIEMAFGRRRDV